MPKAQMTDEFLDDADIEEFARLKLEKGERARLWIPTLDICWIEWVHSIRAPDLDEATGEPISITIQGKNGSRPGWAMKFIGQFICTGREDVLKSKQIDPDRCPGCAASAAGVPGMEPGRRFAFPVVRYNTATLSSATLQKPPGARIYVWSIGQKYYSDLQKCRPEIRDLLEIPESEPVDVTMADIVVEAGAGGGLIDFKAPMRPARAHPAVGPIVTELWETVENRPTDDQLRVAVCRPKARRWIETDIDDATDRWRKTDPAKYGRPAPARDVAGNGSVTGSEPLDEEALNALLADGPGDHPGGIAEFAAPDQRAAVAAAEGADPFAEPGAALTPVPAAADDPFAEPGAPAQPAPAAAPAAQSAAPAAADPFADPGTPASGSNGARRPSAPFDEILAATAEPTTA